MYLLWIPMTQATAPCRRVHLQPLPFQDSTNGSSPCSTWWGAQSNRAVQRPRVHQQDSETSTELSGKEMENKIKWGLIRKANVCRDKATAGIVISQIVLIWANSASETVTMVFMLSSPSWPYLASLAPLNMGQTLITLHQRSLPRHHNHENLELVHKSDKDD